MATTPMIAMPTSAMSGPIHCARGSAGQAWRSGDEEIDASRGDRPAERPREPPAERPAEGEPDADAEEVDHARRDHEAGGVIGRVGGARQLDAVRVAMEDREDADEQERDDLERAPGEGDCRAERQDR